jgi:hypothetical protein
VSSCDELVELGSAHLERNELPEAHAAFSAALQLEPLSRKAWAGLGVAFERAGNLAAADNAWRLAFKATGPKHGEYRGSGLPVRVLVLRSVVEGNVPLEPILDDRTFQWATLLVESFDEAMTLPPHDVVFNAVGSVDMHTRALAMTQRALGATAAPVVNDPLAVRETGRIAIAQRMRSIDGVVTPHIVGVPRAMLAETTAETVLEEYGFAFPLLVRSVGFHGGEHFAYVADAGALGPVVDGLPGDSLLVISFLDTRRADGTVRKYRVLSIGGELYPLHLGISRDWKVHYFSADLRPEHRAEERAFLGDMNAALGADAVRALRDVAAALSLDYAGIDFTVHEGKVVVFEANATMAIVPPGPESEEFYRREPIGRAIEAVRTMIRTRAARLPI